MTTITKLNPTGLSNGVPLAVAATTSPGTTFHTAHATSQDEIWMFLTNQSSSDIVAKIELGSTTAGKNLYVTVPANDTVLAVPGIPVTGAVVVAVYGSTSLTMSGYVNRIA